jgi:A/G-specific adenine glycosylase
MRVPIVDAKTVRALRADLLRWYRKNRRDLPWRRTSDPYRIWISETMLQQTRVSVVIPYYEKFTARFPDAASLASASVDEVLACWAGLGYYRRARLLKRAAEKVATDYGGALPDAPAVLADLPGIGRYTAGAILSIAFGRPAAVLDGNVFRVLSRFFALKGSWRRSADRTVFWTLAEALVPKRTPGDFNQALMELGALVCKPRDPVCPACPIHARCKARLTGRIDRFPAPSPRQAAEIVAGSRHVILDREGRILLVRRPEGGRMEGLWDLPESAPRGARAEKAGIVRHSVLRFRYVIDVFLASRPVRARKGGDARRWVAREDLGSYALTGMAKKAIRIGLGAKRR